MSLSQYRINIAIVLFIILNMIKLIIYIINLNLNYKILSYSECGNNAFNIMNIISIILNIIQIIIFIKLLKKNINLENDYRSINKAIGIIYSFIFINAIVYTVYIFSYDSCFENLNNKFLIIFVISSILSIYPIFTYIIMFIISFIYLFYQTKENDVIIIEEGYAME